MLKPGFCLTPFFVAALGVVAAQSTGVVQSQLKEKFAGRLMEIARRVDGTVGYSILDLTSGDTFQLLEQTEFPAASTIKLGILYELYRRSDDGSLKLDEAVPLDPKRVVGGSGVLKELGTPVLSLRDYATLMVLVSDNTATNVLIDRLGMDAVNRTVQGLGVKQTTLRRSMMDTDAARKGLENTTTPADLVKLLEVFYRGRGLSSGAQAQAFGILKKPKTSAIARGVAPGVDVASKSGELEGVRAEGAVVLARNRPYILAVMTTLLQRDEDGERAIEDLSSAAYGYFSRLGAASSTGRLIDR